MSDEARRFSAKCRRLKGQAWDLSGRLVVVLGEGAQRWGCPEEPGAGFVRCLTLHDADGDCEGGDVCGYVGWLFDGRSKENRRIS